MRPVRLLVPGNIRHNSGGNVYNANLVDGLRAFGVEVVVAQVNGSWPDAKASERRLFGDMLQAQAEGRPPGRPVAVVDGLVAVGAPDELEAAAKAGHRVFVLVHMPVPESSGAGALDREARALGAAAGVICTSSSAASVLASRGISGSVVVLPGTRRAPLARGSVPPHFLAVAALLPNKDQLLIVQALAEMQDLPWTASLVGSDQADPEYARQLKTAVAEAGLGRRLHIAGELTGQPLEAEWSRANLSLLLSRQEAFGMVVTESLAHGVPVVVRDGTGAVEAQDLARLRDHDGGRRLPGAAVALPPGAGESPALLAGVLRRWLEDASLRQSWRDAARQARNLLPGWDRTAEAVLRVLEDHDRHLR